MPTPDTETLAARLRAVERALTDEDTTPDQPTDSRAVATAPPDGAGEHAGGDEEGGATNVERRLCRLEAAVQALRAALDDADPDGTPPAEPSTVDTTSEGGEAGAVTRRPSRPTEGPDPARRAVGDGHWPDDLATE